jgi:HPr kinase/phosphorylase
MNRPGLALAGFFSYFAPKRVQVLGHAEISYLRKLPEAMRIDRFRRMCDRDIPCIVVARGRSLEDSDRRGHRNSIPVFGTSQVTMNFLNAATIRLEHEFAPSVTAARLHGGHARRRRPDHRQERLRKIRNRGRPAGTRRLAGGR